MTEYVIWAKSTIAKNHILEKEEQTFPLGNFALAARKHKITALPVTSELNLSFLLPESIKTAQNIPSDN